MSRFFSLSKRFLWASLILLPYLSISQNVLDSSNTKRHILIFPVVTRSIETNWAFGVLFSSTYHLGQQNISVRTSNMQLLALYSLAHQFVTAINGTAYFPGEKYIINYQVSYSDYPDKFWGIGRSTPDSNKESYSFRQYYIYLHGQRKIGQNLFLGALYENQRLIRIDYAAHGLFDKDNIVGHNGYHVSGAGLSITYDTRNEAFAPDKGLFLQIFFNHFDKYLLSQYSYTNYVIDFRDFFKMGNRQVLAMQLYGFFNAGEVPLRSLASFGGSNSMRGYFNGRYRDKDQVVYQAEDRIFIAGRFAAVGFAGVGNVGKNLSDFHLNYLKYSGGAGLRCALDKKEKLNLRLDYGIGQGSNHGFYFQLGEAF